VGLRTPNLGEEGALGRWDGTVALPVPEIIASGVFGGGCEPQFRDPPTLQTDGQTDGRTDGRRAIARPRFAL